MKTAPPCIIYSRDEELTSRLGRISVAVTPLHPIGEQGELTQWLGQFGDAVLLADLRAPSCLDVLSGLRKSNPCTVVIVIGADRSDPMLHAEWFEPYAKLPLEPDYREFQILLRQAVESLTLRIKNKVLESELMMLNALKSAPKPEPRTLFSTPLQHFSKAQRNVDNVHALMESVVEGLVATARVSRAGIFIKPETSDDYEFQAGVRCLAATEMLKIAPGNPFVRWLEMNTHLVSRKTLDTISYPEERAMLKQMLDSLGAEIIIPLYASGMIKGWIFVGQRSTGIPFDVTDLEELIGLADHISTTLEKAFKYEETALQKALAETVLHSIPFGIVACDEKGIIRWFNSTAQSILQPQEVQVIGRRVEILGSRIADLFHRTIGNMHANDHIEWTDNRTKLTIAAETRCLMEGNECVGAMVMLKDVTGARLLKEKEEQLERATFWNELAASMSHEIRNPLVAIRTFAQLLPERYDDPDFRLEFGDQVAHEVDRLNQIIEKINEFANPPRPEFRALDVRKPIEHAVARIQSDFNHENLKIHLSSEDSTLQVNADHRSLEECFHHLLMNAAENLDNKPGSRINITVKGRSPEKGADSVYIIVSDNGSGIHESLRDKIYSPFSTIKARGLGLGLPIAKRTVIDHNGEIDIQTSSGGTTVTIVLPAFKEGE